MHLFDFILIGETEKVKEPGKEAAIEETALHRKQGSPFFSEPLLHPISC